MHNELPDRCAQQDRGMIYGETVGQQFLFCEDNAEVVLYRDKSLRA